MDVYFLCTELLVRNIYCVFNLFRTCIHVGHTCHGVYVAVRGALQESVHTPPTMWVLGMELRSLGVEVGTHGAILSTLNTFNL